MMRSRRKIIEQKTLLLEKENDSHKREKEEIIQRLQQQEKQINTLKDKQKRILNEEQRRYNAFLNEPVCRQLCKSVEGLQLTTRTSYSDHSDLIIDDGIAIKLGDAVSAHFPELRTRLLERYPKISQKDLLLCNLYLLGLDEKQISMLKGCSYTTIYRQRNNLRKKFKTDDSLGTFIIKLVLNKM